MKKIINKNEKGITLIALVITIIVLLILAGVAISMLAGENGILKQTTEAEEGTKEASIIEQIKLAYLASLINKEGSINYSVLNEELEKVGFDRGIENEGKYPNDIESLPALIEIKGVSYNIEENGQVFIEEGNKPVVNPYGSEPFDIAYTYTPAEGWIEAKSMDDEIKGDIIAKFYKQEGKKISPTNYDLDNNPVEFGEGDAYHLVIEGKGKMGTLVEMDSTSGSPKDPKAWQFDLLVKLGGGSTTPLMPFVTELYVCDGVENIGEFAFSFASSLEKVTISSTIENIGMYAFFRSGLKSIKIPNGVIGAYAFQDCVYLESVQLLNSSSIDNYAFCDCEMLSSVLLSENLISIGEETFSGCSKLDNIVLPKNLTSIGRGAFSGCSSFKSITIPSGVKSIENNMFDSCQNLTNITIPNGVTSIGDEAFYECKNLTSITIPESVTNIGENAFYLCRSLKSVTIPDNVENIGRLAFSNCQGLENVIIMEGVTNISECMFYACYGLKSITIPISVTSIGANAFYGCRFLESVFYKGKEDDWSKVSIGVQDDECLNNAQKYYNEN